MVTTKSGIVKRVFEDKDVIYCNNNFYNFNKFFSLNWLIDRIQLIILGFSLVNYESKYT
jgi:hypothetical protein